MNRNKLAETMNNRTVLVQLENNDLNYSESRFICEVKKID